MRFNLWEDCNRVPLTELLSFVVDNRGKTVPTAPSGHKLIATNCVTNNTLFPVYEKIRYLSEKTYQTWFRAHPISGDILFVNKGTPGRVCLVPDPVDFCIAQDMIALRADESKIYPKYLFAVLRSREIQQQIYNTNVGDVIPHFKKQFLDQLLIPIPERSIQESIGDLYYVLSLKAECNKKINDNLLQQAQALFKSWFVDFEPFSNQKPSDWSVSTLGNVSIMGAGRDKPQNVSPIKSNLCQYPIYSNGLSEEGLYGFTDKPKIFKESVTVSARGTIGFVCLRHIPYVPIVRLVTLIPKTEIISAKYLYLWLKQLHITGTGTTQQQLTVPDFRKTEILVPSQEIVTLFTATVEPIFKKIWANQNENEKLSSLRDTLLPKLMSGELDVSDIDL